MLLNKVEQAIHHLNEKLALLCSILIWLMMAVMVCLVIMRYALNLGSIALQETTLYLHAFIFLMGAGFALKADAHVRVDIIYRQLSNPRKALINLIGTLFFLLPFALCILYYSLDYVFLSWTKKEASGEAGGLPYLYLLKSLLVVFPCVLLLGALEQALSAYKTCFQQKQP